MLFLLHLIIAKVVIITTIVLFFLPLVFLCENTATQDFVSAMTSELLLQYIAERFNNMFFYRLYNLDINIHVIVSYFSYI